MLPGSNLLHAKASQLSQTIEKNVADLESRKERIENLKEERQVQIRKLNQVDSSQTIVFIGYTKLL